MGKTKGKNEMEDSGHIFDWLRSDAGPGGLQAAIPLGRDNRRGLLLARGGGSTKSAIHIENFKMVFPPLPFHDGLRRLNDPALAALDRFLLPPGTRFGDRRQWWDDRARPRPHEGLDLLWYRKRGGEIDRLEPGTRVPALAAGRVVRIVEDFLGRSLFVAHEAAKDGRILVSVYGHVAPKLAVGEEVRAGEVLAEVARPSSSRVPPHLHLSTLRLPAAFPFGRLDWRFLQASPEADFCDPLPLLSCPWEEIPGPPSGEHP